jgi:hypothetical protein
MVTAEGMPKAYLLCLMNKRDHMHRVAAIIVNLVPYHHARWNACAVAGVAETHLVELTDRDEFKVLEFKGKRIALSATSLADAKNAGIAAAKSVGISFASDVSVRAVMVGIGSGPNPIPLDRNSFLLSYWEGFWTASGVKQTNQAQSLNQACS